MSPINRTYMLLFENCRIEVAFLSLFCYTVFIGSPIFRTKGNAKDTRNVAFVLT